MSCHLEFCKAWTAYSLVNRVVLISVAQSKNIKTLDLTDNKKAGYLMHAESIMKFQIESLTYRLNLSKKQTIVKQSQPTGTLFHPLKRSVLLGFLPLRKSIYFHM